MGVAIILEAVEQGDEPLVSILLLQRLRVAMGIEDREPYGLFLTRVKTSSGDVIDPGVSDP